MTTEDRQKLREAATRAAKARRESSVEPKSWELQTSNSFRRIGMHGDGDVLYATTHPHDRHPDLQALPGVLEYIVAAQPRVVLELLDELDACVVKTSKGQGRRDRLAELLGSDSTNFLGTGLTMREFVQLGNAEKMAASWSNQKREERRRRLDAVMRLSIELARVRETTQFATRLAELAIEAVIEGDWKMVDEWAKHFAFDDEDEDMRQRHASVFAIFRELLLQALRAEKEITA